MKKHSTHILSNEPNYFNLLKFKDKKSTRLVPDFEWNTEKLKRVTWLDILKAKIYIFFHR